MIKLLFHRSVAMKVNIREVTLKKKIQEMVTWQWDNKNEAKTE